MIFLCPSCFVFLSTSDCVKWMGWEKHPSGVAPKHTSFDRMRRRIKQTLHSANVVSAQVHLTGENDFNVSPVLTSVAVMVCYGMLWWYIYIYMELMLSWSSVGWQVAYSTCAILSVTAGTGDTNSWNPCDCRVAHTRRPSVSSCKCPSRMFPFFPLLVRLKNCRRACRSWLLLGHVEAKSWKAWFFVSRSWTVELLFWICSSSGIAHDCPIYSALEDAKWELPEMVLAPNHLFL